MSEQKKNTVQQGEITLVTVKAECADCEGTGIFIGAYCHDGAGMVCRRCDGKGWHLISYTPFTARKKKAGVTRVFPSVSFLHLYPHGNTIIKGFSTNYSEYGCTYEEWENGKEPTPFPK